MPSNSGDTTGITTGNYHLLNALFQPEFGTKLLLDDVLRFIQDRIESFAFAYGKEQLIEYLEYKDLSDLFPAETLLQGIPSEDVLDWVQTTQSDIEILTWLEESEVLKRVATIERLKPGRQHAWSARL